MSILLLSSLFISTEISLTESSYSFKRNFNFVRVSLEYPPSISGKVNIAVFNCPETSSVEYIFFAMVALS